VAAELLLMSAIGLTLGTALGYAARKLPPAGSELASRIEELLPQTQCAQCGFPGCRAYAVALSEGEASIDQCPPGGAHTRRQLAELLNRETPSEPMPQPHQLVARIDEARCVGCARCIEVCPVDAIVGAQGLVHTVLSARCTGCELCLPPCPMDCITLLPPPPRPLSHWGAPYPGPGAREPAQRAGIK
jgi:Na+-translocating ferredoxin:NAD+ oxidoreductase subunit B